LDATNQLRILGYFLEEAKEHLQTIEQGILNLGSTAQDSESIDEVFRAAHSIKGGAAMLGYTSIQKTAHRLEDAFKIFKENTIEVDRQLEALFLAVFDILQSLIEQLSNDTNFKDEDAAALMAKAEPNFANLNQYLQKALGGGAPTVDISQQVKNVLREMLQLFKQPESSESRQMLGQYCQKLAGIAPNSLQWQNLLKVAVTALGNTKYNYSTLAQVIIQDLKNGGDYLHLGKQEQIVPSKNLQQLAGISTAPAQISIPLDSKAAAVALLKSFNRQQLVEIVQILQSQLTAKV
jgi:chemotaxis protein histidine kinase CheA